MASGGQTEEEMEVAESLVRLGEGPSIVREGFLMKRGEHFKNWRSRYFVLYCDGQFLGYKTRPLEAGGGGGEVTTASMCNKFTVRGCQTRVSDLPRPGVFALRGLHEDTVVERMFHCETEQQRSEWLRDIETVRDSLVSDHTPDLHNDLALTWDRKVTMEDFELMKVLGRGAFGKVVLCREKETGTMYAMKILKKSMLFDRNEVEHTLTENRVLSTVRHPFIVGLKYSFTTEDRLCFVTEYVRGGEIFVHLRKERRFSEDRTRFYAAEIVSALGYLHKRGIIYRDLKLENLLLDKHGHIKMVDFGLCKDEIFGSKLTGTFCGTPSYLPPEVIRSSQYGRAVDWWGLGIVMFEMLTGQLPFYHEERKVMFRLICTERVKFPRTVVGETRELLHQLLVKNPERRLGGGSADSEEIMHHPFFAPIHWSDLEKKRIVPPFKPELTDELDTRYVDPEFAGDSSSLTPPNSQDCRTLLGAGEGIFFSEFSYQNPSSVHSRRSILSSSSRSLEIAV